MERKYRDEGWHNPSDAPPIDYPVVYLLLPFASVAFLVALMKGPSVIVLISLFRFHLSLFSSFSLSRSTNPPPPHQTLQIRTRKQNRKTHRCADPCTNVRTCKQPSCSFPFENQWSRCACACTNAIYRLPQRYRFLSVLTHEPFSLDAREHTSVEHRDSPIRSIDPSPSSIVFLDSSRERRPIVRGPNDRLPAAGGTRCLPPCSSLDRKSILLRNRW